MKNVFFNNEVLAAESKIISTLKIPSLILMENAGRNSAGYIRKYFAQYKNVIILSGKGNNAGDGFVAARHLSTMGFSVSVMMIYSETDLRGDAKTNFEILKKTDSANLKILRCRNFKDVRNMIRKLEDPLLIDAVFGVGFKGNPDKQIEEIFKVVNSENAPVISLDIPSGLYDYNQSSICIRADLTLAMGVRKFSSMFYKGREFSGNVKVMNIGISEGEFTKYNSRKIFRIEKSDIKKILPVRSLNSNKYTNGKVFILTGSKGLTGASYLSALSALRCGSGAVVAGIPESVADIMEVKLTEVMKLPLAETSDGSLSLKSYEQMKSRLTWADSVLIGPGISKNSETMELVRKIVKENDCFFVVDADAINAFRDNLNLLRNKKIILTPHSGEFANLINRSTEEVISDFYELAYGFAGRYKITLVLKNSPTIVTDGSSFCINSAGKENLATAGTGDVLSGIIASELSRTKNTFEAAIAGVYIHGMCGDKLFETTGPESTIAGDLINEIAWAKNQIVSD